MARCRGASPSSGEGQRCAGHLTPSSSAGSRSTQRPSPTHLSRYRVTRLALPPRRPARPHHASTANGHHPHIPTAQRASCEPRIPPGAPRRRPHRDHRPSRPERRVTRPSRPSARRATSQALNPGSSRSVHQRHVLNADPQAWWHFLTPARDNGNLWMLRATTAPRV
jgi:hypothetical protein